MRTPAVPELIEAFRHLPVRPETEGFKRLELILSLADHGTPEAADFLITVAADPKQEYLARLEALKVLAVWEQPEAAMVERLQALLLELLRDGDKGLRNYAVGACRWQYRNAALVDTVVDRLLDRGESPLVRSTAFQVAEQAGPEPAFQAALTELAGRPDEAEFAAEATRVLNRWESENDGR